MAGRSPAGRPGLAGLGGRRRPARACSAPTSRASTSWSTSYDMTSAPFGHFGDGCMHVRLDYPLDRPDGTAVLRAFLTDAAKLVGEYGGSLSGEHGDGRARSELLPHMYSPDAIAMFGGIKHAFDPTNLLNPGVLVDPDPVDADVRFAGDFPLSLSRTKKLAFAYPHDDGDLAQAVHRCTGVGKCRADNAAAGGVMCPSYLATREEKDSTRGRARVLQDVVRGELAVERARGARRPRPVPVLQGLRVRLPDRHRHGDVQVRGAAPDLRRTPVAAAPALALLARPAAAVGTTRRAGAGAGGGGQPGAAAAGPRGARQVARRGRRAALGAGVRAARRSTRRTAASPSTAGTPVVLFADSFSDSFDPEVAAATVRVLEAAGYAPRLPETQLCCGLTWITTGQLDAARRILGATVASLAEPAASRRADRRDRAVVHRGAAQRRRRAARQRRRPGRSRPPRRPSPSCSPRPQGWTPPDLTGTTVVAQPHCHHHAVLGWARRRRPARRHRCDRPAALGLLRPGRQLRGRDRPLRRLGGRRRAAAPAGPRRRTRRGRPGRRLLLPHPGRRPPRPARRCTWPSCSTRPAADRSAGAGRAGTAQVRTRRPRARTARRAAARGCGRGGRGR